MWWGRRPWLHLVVTGPVPYFLVKELCCVWSLLSCSSLLTGIFVCSGFRGKQQVPPVVAEGQVPRCPGSRLCPAEVQGHYKHMKDPIKYFLQANKTQRIFFFFLMFVPLSGHSWMFLSDCWAFVLSLPNGLLKTSEDFQFLQRHTVVISSVYLSGKKKWSHFSGP